MTTKAQQADIDALAAKPRRPRVRWGTQTRDGHTCFTGLRTKREARRLADEWSARFPDQAPYAITRRPS